MLKKVVYQIVIGILLLTNILYWCEKKEGFHGDELYSYQFVSSVEYPSINGDREETNYLNTWHTAKYYSDYLEISSEESFDLVGVWESIKKDVHPPIFYLLLEIVCSLFFIDNFTRWSGLILNIIFFVLTIGVLYLLAKKVFNSSWGGMLVCLAYGFSIGAVNTILFIRMYMVLTFVTVCICYIHMGLWELLVEKDINRCIRVKWYSALLVMMLFGTLTQYYFWIFVFFLCAYFWLCILLYKKWYLAFEYAITIGVSILFSIVIWPDFISDLFGGYRGDEAINNFMESHLLENVTIFFSIIDEEVFSGIWTLLLKQEYIKWMLLVLILVVGIYIASKRPKMLISKERMAVGHIVVTVVAYLLIIAKVAPYQTDRYIFNIFPLIILTYIFVILQALCKFRHEKIIKVVITAGVLFFMFLGYKEGEINYLYKGTNRNVDIINDYKNIPAVMITNNNRRYVSCENSIYFREICATYPTDLQGSGDLSVALTLENGNEQYFLFVDKTLQDVENIVSQVIASSEAKSREYLFSSATCDVYLIDL